MTEKRSRYPYRYETHLHTSDGSACARMSAEEQIKFYADRAYTGVFVTEHFWGNNACKADKEAAFETQVEQYFAFSEQAKKYGKKYGIDVFCGIEYSYKGTDLLVYGLEKETILEHPEIPELKLHEFATMARECGALVFQAHPFRLCKHTKILRFLPRFVDGFETVNGSNTDHENKMAGIFCRKYGLKKFAGSDNHGTNKGTLNFLAGVETTRRVKDEQDFVQIIKDGKYRIFEREI